MFVRKINDKKVFIMYMAMLFQQKINDYIVVIVL